jgi:lipid II isoglutaminyl synthase (glutamine-hydrolysing)
MSLSLTLTHLYPDNLNLYGDLGNVVALKRRCEWLGIDCELKSLNLGDAAASGQTDIYFMGGGQDNDQLAVVDDFHQLKHAAIRADTEAGTVFLGVCGGYQLMGNTFIMGDNQETQGLGIINVSTKAPNKEVKERCIGNLVAELPPTMFQEMQAIYEQPKDIPQTLVGFENHSGQTFLGEDVAPLAHTRAGFGNNHEAQYEGARYKNVFGSYMHGSMLPKNPHFADYMLWLALSRKYKDQALKLKALPDTEEIAAHQYIVLRYG